MGPTPQVNAKYNLMMKLSVFGTWTDTHTHKAKTIFPRYVGCNYKLLERDCNINDVGQNLITIHAMLGPGR